MNLKQQKWPGEALSKMWLVCFTFCVLSASSQSVIVPPPSVKTMPEPTAEKSSDTNQTSNGSAGATATSSGGSHLSNPFQWGSIVLHPSISYGLTYATGLQSGPGQSQDSVIQTVTPGINFDLGEHWRLGYSAALNFYSDSTFSDSVNHNMFLNWNTVYEDWSFFFVQTMGISSDSQVATAQQTDQKDFSTSAGFSRQLGSDFSLDVSGSQHITDTGGFTNVVVGTNGFGSPVGSVRDWSGSGWLNYHWGPYFSPGVGITGGYSDVETGTDMTYENFQGRIFWRFTHKFSLTISGGAQYRQFLNTDIPSKLSPILSATLLYQPFEQTSLSLSANRDVSASSYYQDQITETTGVNFGLHQRFFEKYSLGVSSGYTHTTYKTAAFTPFGPIPFSRDDDYVFYSIALSRSFLTHGTTSISYSWSKNLSSTQGYGFASNQIGFSVAWSY
jgi:hypothetical protein